MTPPAIMLQLFEIEQIVFQNRAFDVEVADNGQLDHWILTLLFSWGYIKLEVNLTRIKMGQFIYKCCIACHLYMLMVYRQFLSRDPNAASQTESTADFLFTPFITG